MDPNQRPPAPEWNPNQSDQSGTDAYGTHPASAANDSSVDPRFAGLNISKGEHVIRDMPRHVIGVLQIYVVAVLAIVGILIGTGALLSFAGKPQQEIIAGTSVTIPPSAIVGVGLFLALLAVVITIIAVKVYYGNRLYLTNESVIQRIQTSLLHTKEQQIPLGNVEDVSFDRRGLLQQLFNYGTIRLSTEGEETTYYFYYASDPRTEVGQIIQAMEEFNRQNPSTKH